MNSLAEQKMEEGHMALALGEMKEAAVFYRSAAEMDPENAEAWQALGMSLVKLDLLEEANPALQ